MPAVSAIDEPARAMELSNSALSRLGMAEREERDPPSAPKPPECIVTLPGGLVDLVAREIITEAEVRELDGDDEEAIARAGNNLAKVIDTILLRGVVAVGERPVSKDILDGLLAGDRDALLIAVRRATFGDEVELTGTCPDCQTKQDIVVSLSRDVPTSSLDDPTDSQFELTLKSGNRVAVVLPDGVIQRALLASEERNEAVLSTQLLTSCVQSINGVPVAEPGPVKKMSIRDRREILAEINERTPGPRLGEVTRPCSECDKDIPCPLSTVGLFLY